MVNRFGINLKMSGHLQIMNVTNYILQCKSQYRNKYAYTYLSIPTKTSFTWSFCWSWKRPEWWPRFKQETMARPRPKQNFPPGASSAWWENSIKSIYGAPPPGFTTGLMSVVAKGSRPVRVVTVLMHEEKPQNSINTVPTNLSFEMFLKKTFNEFELVSTSEKIMIVKMDHFSTKWKSKMFWKTTTELHFVESNNKPAKLGNMCCQVTLSRDLFSSPIVGGH